MTIGYGDVIRARRKELKMSQRELAELACVHRETVLTLEKNSKNTRIDCFISVLNALGLKLDIVEIGGEKGAK